MWDAAIGEVLVCEREPHNVEDCYAVAVRKDETIIGHLPRNLSRICLFFIRRGGVIEYTVTGAKRYSAELKLEKHERSIKSRNVQVTGKVRGHLPQGGLEVPCFLC